MGKSTGIHFNTIEMGAVADSMINGEACTWCGCYLEPGEIVYLNSDTSHEVRMPSDGSGYGVAVICGDCCEG